MHARFLALSRSFLQAWLRGVLWAICWSAIIHHIQIISLLAPLMQCDRALFQILQHIFTLA